MSAQSLASFCCSSRKCWCSCASSQPMARSTPSAQRSPLHRAVAAHVVHRDQPPQSGVDAAQVPEVRVAAFRVHVLGNLPVGSLLRGQRVEAGHGALFQGRHAGAAHRHDAHGRVAPEDPRVAPGHRRRGAARGQDAVGREVAFEQREGGFRTGIDQREGVGVEGMVCHGMRWAGGRAADAACARQPHRAVRPGALSGMEHRNRHRFHCAAGRGTVHPPWSAAGLARQRLSRCRR